MWGKSCFALLTRSTLDECKNKPGLQGRPKVAGMLTLLAAAMVSSTPPAKPQRPPLPRDALVFVVRPDGSQGPHAVELEAQLFEAVKNKGVQMTDVDKHFPTPPSTNTGAQLAKEGREALDALDHETAKKKLGDALRYLTAEPAAATPKLLSDVHLGLAAAQVSDKAAAKAVQAHLVSALTLRPDAAVEPKLLTPELRKLWTKAEAELKARPSAPLAVEVAHGATVEIRANTLTAPFSATTLHAGQHLVVAHKPGHARAGTIVELKAPGATATLALTPAPGLLEAQREAGVLIASPTVSGARALGTRLKTRFLVLVDPNNRQMVVLDAQEGRSLQAGAIADEPQGVTKAAEQVKTFIDQAPVVVAETPKAAATDTTPTQAEASGSVLTKPWFWAVVGGVVVAGTAVGVTAAATSGGRGYNPTLNF